MLSACEIASWAPLPDFRSESSWFGADYDVLVVDCYDEMLRPAAWPKGDTAIREGRWLLLFRRRHEIVSHGEDRWLRDHGVPIEFWSRVEPAS